MLRNLPNPHSDRFILPRNPNSHSTVTPLCSSPQQNDKYQRMLYRQLLSHPQQSLDSQILSLLSLKNQNTQMQEQPPSKTINPQAQRILDAPEIKDDYYLNLLDWSSKGILSIGLAERVYLYSPSRISELCVQMQGNYICSLNFHPQGNELAVGLHDGKTQIYDIQTQTLLRTIKGHTGRVSSSAYTYNLLYTGSKDSTILGHDPRAHQNVVLKLQGHRGEVCGLRHDACGLASGSNDDLAMVWDLNMGKVRYTLQGHKGAVKALAWCQWQRGLLVTGGGTSDKTMRMWNVQNGKCINVINTQSQVCSIVSHPDQRQIISSHGYSQNQLSIWKVNKSQINHINCHKTMQLYGHTQRVLHMSLSPDASTVCTASADETLRFWRVFQDGRERYQERRGGKGVDFQSCSLR